MRIITGMHRSGTSLVAQILYNMGADFGSEEDLLGATRWNPRGHYENKHVVDLNNKLIVGAHASIEDWIAANEEGDRLAALRWGLNKLAYLKLPASEKIFARARDLRDAIEELSRRSSTMVTKDTRFSLTMRPWQEFGDFHRVLYVFRHPHEVAGSLRRREKIPRWMGYSQWSVHVDRFLDEVDRDRMILFNYNDLVDPDRSGGEVRRLFRFLDRDPEPAEAQSILDRTFDPALRHHIGAGAPVPSGIRRRYEMLLELHAASSGDAA